MAGMQSIDDCHKRVLLEQRLSFKSFVGPKVDIHEFYGNKSWHTRVLLDQRLSGKSFPALPVAADIRFNICLTNQS